VVPHILALAVTGAALAVFYPEVTAFAVLTTVLVAGLEAVRRREFPTNRLTLIVYALFGVFVLLRYNLLSYVFTIMLQMGQGFRAVDLSLSLFPYFMIPTGLANLFGLMPLSVNFAEPITSLTIVAGLVALIVALAFAVRNSFRGAPMAVLLIVQFVLAIRLMRSGNDFGLYKIAMFMQPALTASLAFALLKLPLARFTAPLGVVIAAACCAPTALYYTRASEGEKAGGITEAKLASVLGTKAPPTPPNTRLLCDINNLVAAKLAAFELRGIDLRYLSRDYYQQIAPIEFEKLGDTLVSLHPRFDDLMRTRAMLAQRDQETIRDETLFDTSFRAPKLSFAKDGKTDAYLLLDESLGLFNKFEREPGQPPATFFKELSAAQARNHLVFIHTGRGNHYYLGDRNRIAIFQPEADPYTKKQDITGLGRFLMLRVEQPDAEIYLRISASKTFMSHGHTAWSNASQILAEKTVPLSFRGNGAVNRIIGPIRPVYRDGAAYIAIDFSEVPTQFKPERSGLQALYNTQVPLDSRKLVAYGRDISALSPSEVAALKRPARLARFPDDILFARGLEFSGIYEDGWLSPESEFILAGTTTAGCVRVRGFVPELPGSPLGGGTMKVTLGGREFDLPAATGAFDWLLPVPANTKTTRISVRFTSTAPLPNGDDRPTGAKLDLLEVLPALPTETFNFGTPGGMRLAASGIDQDGWMTRAATVEIPASNTPRELRLKVEYPDWSGAPASTLRTQLSDDAPATHTLKPGAYADIRVRVPACATTQTLRLDAATDFPLPAPNTRRRTGRLVQVALAPAA
jgi:hypothetical protein